MRWMMKCVICEIEFEPSEERKKEFPESLIPRTCDKCCYEIIKSQIENYKNKIKILKRF